MNELMEYQKKMIEKLFEQYNAVVFLDTETTGLDPVKNDVIELGIISFTKGIHGPERSDYQALVKLPEGESIPPEISKLTSITNDMVEEAGISPQDASFALSSMMRERSLVVGHNISFDILFLQNMIDKAFPEFVESPDFPDADLLDTLTVLRDRKEGSHKLSEGLQFYGIECKDAHQAIEDANSSLLLMTAMAKEQDNIKDYFNVIGYNPKYGKPENEIYGMEYREQRTQSSINSSKQHR